MGWPRTIVRKIMSIKNFGKEYLVCQSFGILRERLLDYIQINVLDVGSEDW
jgi:hypothetical protein